MAVMGMFARLWNNESELHAFAKSGAHLEAMKISKRIAKEIRTITIDADSLPDWKEAKKLLENGKSFQYWASCLFSRCINSLQHIGKG